MAAAPHSILFIWIKPSSLDSRREKARSDPFPDETPENRMNGAWRATGVDDLLSLRVVLLSVDVPAQKILPPFDLGALASGKVSPAHTVRADGTVEVRFPVLEPRGFPCGQLAGRD